jgi:hypothetical protein
LMVEMSTSARACRKNQQLMTSAVHDKHSIRVNRSVDRQRT